GALFGIVDDAETIDSVVVRRLAGLRTFPLPAVREIEDHGDLDAVIESIEALPADCRRRRHIEFAQPVQLDAWRRTAFPDFGLYTLDDNLAIEYVLGAERRVDPGTLCYTPSRAGRNRYRSAEAHDVVRAIDW